MDERKKLERELTEAKKKLALGGGGDGASFEKTEIGPLTFAHQAFDGVEPKDLRTLASEIMAKSGAAVVAVGSNFDGKAAIVVTATADSKVDSAALIRVATPAVGGQGGGGRPEMAQGGGPEGTKIPAALEAVKAELTNMLDNAA